MPGLGKDRGQQDPEKHAHLPDPGGKELRETGGCRAEGRPESIWAQNVYQALVGVVQLLQDLIHYGIGQVGDNGELHLAVDIGGAVQLLTVSPPASTPSFPRCLRMGQLAGPSTESIVAVGSTLGPVHPYLYKHVCRTQTVITSA